MSNTKELSEIARTLEELPYPKKFAVEVCAECNLSCAMCHHGQMRRPKGKMPLELWRRLANELAANAPGTECWFSFCGEPFLEPELLLDMLRYGQRAGLTSLNVNTNGMLLTAAYAEAVLTSGVGLVVFGIDGFSRDVYESVRCGASRDVVYANAEHLLNVRDELGVDVEIQIQFIEMEANKHELDEFSPYWLERGATLKVRKQLSWGGKFDTALCVPPEERIACPWAVTMMHVFWDGRVPRCPGDTEGEEGVGNAWDAPINVLWAGLGSYRQKHLERRFDELPERCHTCTDWMTGAAKRVRPQGAPRRSVPGRVARVSRKRLSVL